MTAITICIWIVQPTLDDGPRHLTMTIYDPVDGVTITLGQQIQVSFKAI